MRDYKHEYAEYQGKPQQIKNRAARNHAHLEETKKLGHSFKGDVAHKVALVNGGKNVSSNEKVESASKNRSWRKGQKGYHVPVDN